MRNWGMRIWIAFLFLGVAIAGFIGTMEQYQGMLIFGYSIWWWAFLVGLIGALATLALPDRNSRR
ncbi:MAG: hypothetical protein ABSC49_00030 [Candidatus Microgenomates bacterium]|jgi:hypothetical protein